MRPRHGYLPCSHPSHRVLWGDTETLEKTLGNSRAIYKW